MAVVQDKITSGSFDASSTSVSFTGSVTPGGLNRYMLVFVNGGNISTPAPIAPTVTCGGIPMTLIKSGSNNAAASYPYAGAFGLVAPTEGSPPITCSIGASNYDVSIKAISFTGVDQSTPIRNSYFTSGSVNPSIVVSSAVDDLVYDGLGTRFIDTPANSVTTGDNTRLWYWSATDGNFGSVGSSAPGAATVNMNWNLNGVAWADVAVSIQASSAGPGPSPTVGLFNTTGFYKTTGLSSVIIS